MSAVDARALHLVDILIVENFVHFDQIDLQHHILGVPDELFAQSYCPFVAVDLWVGPLCVHELLVRVDFGLDCSAGNQLLEFCLDLLERNSKSRRNFSHIDDLVWFHISLESLDSDLFEHLGSEMFPEIGIILKLLFDLVELALELLKSTEHEIFKDINSVWVLLEKRQDGRVCQDILLQLVSRQLRQTYEDYIVREIFLSEDAFQVRHLADRNLLKICKFVGHHLQVVVL